MDGAKTAWGHMKRQHIYSSITIEMKSMLMFRFSGFTMHEYWVFPHTVAMYRPPSTASQSTMFVYECVRCIQAPCMTHDEDPVA